MTKANRSTNAAVDQSPAAALWRIVVSEYESATASYAIIAAEYEAAMDADDRLSFREQLAQFERFGTINPHYADDAIRMVYAKLYAERPIVDEDASDATDVERAELFAKAAQIVADYAKLSEQMVAARESIYREAEPKHDAACDVVSNARNKLLATPAPDAEGMLLKLEILASLTMDCDSEDKESIAAIRDDARRLLRGK